MLRHCRCRPRGAEKPPVTPPARFTHRNARSLPETRVGGATREGRSFSSRRNDAQRQQRSAARRNRGSACKHGAAPESGSESLQAVDAPECSPLHCALRIVARRDAACSEIQRSTPRPRDDRIRRPAASDRTSPMATYVQVVCERAVVAGDRRRSHVIDVGDWPGLVDALTRYERNERSRGAPTGTSTTPRREELRPRRRRGPGRCGRPSGPVSGRRSSDTVRR